MTIRTDISFDWEVSPRQVTVNAPSTEFTMQDILDTLRYNEALIQNMDNQAMVEGNGKVVLDDQGNATGLTVQLINTTIGFEIRSGPAWIECYLSGGNLSGLEADKSTVTTQVTHNNPYVNINKTLSVSATISEGGSGGLTTEEHDWLNDTSYTIKSIYINTELVVNGNGKENAPFNNIADAVDYAELRGWKKLIFLADATLERTLKNFTIDGIGMPTIDFNTQNVDKSEFSKVKLIGQQVGSITAREVVMLDGLSGVSGIYKESGLAGNITMANNSYSTFASISTLFLTTPNTYTIDMGAANTNVVLNVRKLSGAIELLNVNTPTKFATFEFSGGKFVAGATNTSGVIGIAGIPDSAVDINLATSTKITDGLLPSAETTANFVWEKTLP